jgi:hypothetical protein
MGQKGLQRERQFEGEYRANHSKKGWHFWGPRSYALQAVLRRHISYWYCRKKRKPPEEHSMRGKRN